MIEESDNDWGTISELYTLARRSVLSIDTAIQEMLTEINKNEVILSVKRKKTMQNLQMLVFLSMIYLFKHREKEKNPRAMDGAERQKILGQKTLLFMEYLVTIQRGIYSVLS
jgi:hypothetical protein